MSLWRGLVMGVLFASRAYAQVPTQGGDLVYAQSSFPPCLDLAQSARAQNATRQALDNLVEQDKVTGNPLPWLATSWDIQDGGKRFVFKLRPGITFSNGQPLDATAVKANFDALVKLGKDGRAPQAAGYLSGLVGTEVVDPATISIAFEQPKAGFLQSLSEKTLSMLAPETLAKTPEERCAGQLIGSGPFVISKVVVNDRIVLTRRADYQWGSPNGTHTGPAYLNSITFQTVPEGSVRVGILVSGQVGIADDLPTDAYKQVLESGANVIARTAGGMGITLLTNTNRPLMTDPAVRKALVHAIDRNEVLKALYTQYDHAATSILSSTVPDYVDLSGMMTYDPDAAGKILDAGGWVPGADGTREKDGKKLRLELIWSFPGFKPDMELVKEQLSRVGIDLVLRLRTDAEMGAVIRGGRYDFRMGDLTRPDPDVLLAIFSSKFNPLIKLPQPDLDGLLVQQSVTIDPAARAKLVRSIQELIVREGYGYPIKESSTIVSTRKDVHGLWLSTPRWPVLYDTFISPTK